MYAKELRRVEKKITCLCSKGFFCKKNIYLFGVSDNARQIIKMLETRGIKVEAVIDNDVSKQGSFCARKPVVAFNAIEHKEADSNLFLVYSAYWKEMIGQLKCSDIKRKNILLLNKKKGPIILLIANAVIGLKEYNKIVDKYKTNNIFLCPYTGTGDIYLIGTFWKEYCNKNNIKEYAFLVISKACQKVAQLCDIDNVELLRKQEISANIIYAHMLWPEDVKIKLLNDCWAQIHTNQIEWFRGYKGLEFTPLFRKYVFDLPDSLPKHPAFKNADNEIAKIIEEKGLTSGNTVVLSPYSNTLSDLPDDFWEILADKLIKLDYLVCTNSSGKSEPAVKGTIPVFCSLNIAPQFIEKMGYFVGIRSGFCDVISGANAKKIILYDKRNRFYMGSAYEYFNLKDMGLCNDAYEIEFGDSDIEQVMIDIIDYIEKRKTYAKKSYTFDK